jgi:hypothetical protein
MSNFRRPTAVSAALFALCALLAMASLPACNSQKTGCPINEEAGRANTNKKGELSTKRGKSNLFPKGMR